MPQPEPPMIATTLPRGIAIEMPVSTGRAVVGERDVGELDRESDCAGAGAAAGAVEADIGAIFKGPAL